MVDAVLIEWEQVLVDVARPRRDAMIRALHDEGLELDGPAYSTHCEGKPVSGAAAAALAHLGHRDATLADLVVMRAARLFDEWVRRGFLLTAGARDFIGLMQSASRVAIVTSASRSETEFVLRLADLEAAVCTIVTADDVVSSFPSAASHVRALELLARVRAVTRSRVVALGATTPPLYAARDAGLRALAVSAEAHVAVIANGAADTLEGLVLDDLARLTGIARVERLA